METGFKAEGMLEGTALERMELARRRFRDMNQPIIVKYEKWTYGDLKKLAQAIKDVAREKYQIEDVKVGTLLLGTFTIYGAKDASPFVARHPNVTLAEMNRAIFLNITAKLSKDAEKYGAFPDGIPEGTPFTEFFGKQWGNLSAKVGLDAIVFRDGIMGTVPYRREGPFGKVPSSDPAKVEVWTKATADLVRQTKKANPKGLVIGYSGGACAVADWRVNCFDLEAIAKEGYLDGWIDETWGGAWNEAGMRGPGPTYWNSQLLGWTYQLSYMLGHAAVLADTKVRHYFLTEMPDGWEPEDVIHNAKERLRWGIWAYSHATVKTPRGLKMPAGSYLSWGHRGENLLPAEDVKFLADTSNEAILDARNTTKVFGPTLVYCRSAMAWQSQNQPAEFIKEWIDEQAGTLVKWSVPILSITRSEYLPSVESDMFLFQTPVHLNAQETENILKLLGSGKPVGVFGSPAGGLDADIANIIGVSTKDTSSMKSLRCIGTIDFQTEGIYQSLPNTFPLFQPFTQNKFAKGLESIYSVSGSPCLGYNQTSGKQLVFWDPPEFSNNLPDGSGGYGRSLDQILGSPTLYVLTARLLNETLKKSGAFHVSEIRQYEPVNLAMWQLQDGGYKVMAANLEEGINHTADSSSSAVVNLPQLAGHDQLTTVSEKWGGTKIVIGGQKFPIHLEHGQTKLFMLK